ncbi:MAG: methyltransferase domain-containing protein [Hyphomicrobiaceae bacterium]
MRLAKLGDLDAAVDAFVEAIALDRRNLDLQYNLSILQEQRGEIDQAAALLTEVLHRKPLHPQAASRLSRLLARYQIEDLRVLDAAGLKAALMADNIAHQPIVDCATKWLVANQPSIEASIDLIERGKGEERICGKAVIAERTAEFLKHEALLLCLRQGIIKHPGFERLLTGVRASLLLDCATARFDDRGLTGLALALIVQGWNNDHAWAETSTEIAALSALAIDRAALLAGDREATRRLICAALYRPLDEIIAPPLTADEARRLKPRSLRETIEPQVIATARQRAAGAAIPSLKSLIDTTSLKVAGQYEAAPYPRWHSLHISAPGALTHAIKERLPAGTHAWLDHPFEVLIAGCGTGQQALQSATGYGPTIHLTALDLSRASLGYASDMADRHQIANVSFVLGDILDAGLIERDFDIIECVGVLHHMADWRAGWRALLQRLKPTGLMYIGLYSAVSRQNLCALRAESTYPGPGCDTARARDYRRELLLRDDAVPGGDLKISRDFYSLNAFRDLVLHESEAHVTIEEIAEFLDANRLLFRGFTVEADVQAEFAAAYPGSGRPGTLANWAAFERSRPRLFDAMYRFWVERQS